MYMKRITSQLTLLLLLFLPVSGCGGDSADDISQTQKKLKLISQAIKMFKSEKYFGKPPASLQELHSYQTTFYNTPQHNSIYGEPNTEDNAPKKFVKTTDTFSLIDNPRIFLRSGLDKEDEDKIISGKEFVTDFDFLPKYPAFPAPNTIIVWDKPGNFESGGNVLFENGQVQFIKASPKEYKRFAIGLLTQTDRDFIRDICIRNNTDCSLANIRKEQPPQ